MIIIADTREKRPWDFSNFEECEGQIRQKVDTGDYQIAGYESIITIDRKQSVCELASNLSKDYERFRKELIRMKDFKYSYILCEFSLSDVIDYPHSANLSPQKMKLIKTTGEKILKQITTIEEKYKVRFLFCNSREEAQERAIELFNNVIIETKK